MDEIVTGEATGAVEIRRLRREVRDLNRCVTHERRMRVEAEARLKQRQEQWINHARHELRDQLIDAYRDYMNLRALPKRLWELLGFDEYRRPRFPWQRRLMRLWLAGLDRLERAYLALRGEL